MTGFYYRYADFLESSGGYDMSGEWEPGPSVVRVQIEQFEVVKKTPKGAWIVDNNGDRRLILDHWFNKYANPTLDGARRDFIARKKKLIAIQEARIRDARLAIATAEKNIAETGGLAGLPTRLKRLYSWELELLK